MAGRHDLSFMEVFPSSRMEFGGVAWVFATSTKIEKGFAEVLVCRQKIECLERNLSPDRSSDRVVVVGGRQRGQCFVLARGDQEGFCRHRWCVELNTGRCRSV